MIYIIITLLSSACSIGTALIPNKFRGKKITYILYVFVSALLCCIIINQYSELNRIHNIGKTANRLTKQKEFNFTNKGYIQAGLSFLEQNKDLYPDDYKRANKISASVDKDSTSEVEGAFEIDGIINGIAIINQEKE